MQRVVVAYDAYVRCRAHAQKIGSREAECMLARTNLPLDDIRYDVTITHIERPDCLYIQRVPPTDKDPGFSDDPDPTLEAAAEELQTLEEIMAKINEPDYFKKYTPLTTASEGKWALCPNWISKSCRRKFLKKMPRKMYFWQDARREWLWLEYWGFGRKKLNLGCLKNIV